MFALVVAGLSAYYTDGQRAELRIGSQLDQRAWMGFLDESVSPATNDKGKLYKLERTVKNTVKTPAQRVEVEATEAPRLRDTSPNIWNRKRLGI